MDDAHSVTDKRLARLEKRIDSIYSRASYSIFTDWQSYLDKINESLKTAEDELENAKKSGDKQIIAEAQKKFDDLRIKSIMQNQRYESLMDSTVSKLARANETALGYVNNELPLVYSVNYNAVGTDAESVIKGYTYEAVNEETVKALATKDKGLLPYKRLDIPKDKVWNSKKINAEMLQGILRGESVNDIAKRLQTVTDMNQTSATRNARTMVTGAENSGRLEGYKKLEADGVELKKRWIAVRDSRTRHEHAQLDGQIVDVDKPFEVDGYKIMNPGDKTAEAFLVYNCRCTMASVITGYKGKSLFTQGEASGDVIAETRKAYLENGIIPDSDTLVKCGESFYSDTDDDYYRSYQKLLDIDGKIESIRSQNNALLEKLMSENNGNFSVAYRILDKDVDYQKRLSSSAELVKERENLRTSVETEFAKKITSKRGEGDAIGFPKNFTKDDKKDHFNGTTLRNQGRVAIESAYSLYPTSWVQRSIDYSGITTGAVNRGYCALDGREVMISGWSERAKHTTAIHELGHRFEKVMPEIKDAESAFYTKRTAGEDLAWLGQGYSHTEKTRKDHFVDAYMGKDYGGDAYELVSMGFEHAYQYNAQQYFKNDKEYLNWITGILCVF